MELDFAYALLLIVTGIVAGIINTLAGSGANLTLPALMVMGMPADIANATNRVSVMQQNLTALAAFRRYARLPTEEIGPVLVPTLVGGLFGALALVVFIYQELVLWVPGLTLAAGSMVGAHLAVKFAISARPSTLKWLLFLMTLAGTLAALAFD